MVAMTRRQRRRRTPAALRRAGLLALVMLTASCGSLVEPFQGVPRLPEGSADIGDRIGVCYNKIFSTPEQVRVVAAEACGPDTTPQLLEQDLRLSCPLLTPARATFQCLPE
jgi:hypothetical protein